MNTRVDYGQLDAARELLSRQSEHLDAIGVYLDRSCRVNASDFGFLLQMLHPLNEAVVDAAGVALRHMGGCSDWGARTMGDTLSAYVEADRAAYEDARAVMANLGISLPGFQDPLAGAPGLGNPASSADSDHGTSPSSYAPSLDILLDTGSRAQQATELVTGTAADIASRVTSYGSRGGVVERTDPQSYLVAPHVTENFAEDMRWNAGLILGSVDWVAEQFFGFSILEEYVFKPFGGDWQAFEGASQSWGHAGTAMMETASNYSGLPGQLDTWTGDGAVALHGAMAAMAGAATAVSYAFDFVASMVDKVSTVTRLACSGVAMVLNALSNKLARLAVEASVPVAGWIVATAEVALLFSDVMRWVRIMNTLITMVLDAIEEFLDSRAKLVDVIMMVEDLAASALTRAVRA